MFMDISEIFLIKANVSQIISNKSIKVMDCGFWTSLSFPTDFIKTLKHLDTTDIYKYLLEKQHM